MERLSALDAGFLEAEDADPHVSLAVAGAVGPGVLTNFSYPAKETM